MLFLSLQAASVETVSNMKGNLTMKENYKEINSMKEVPDQLRKLRRQYLRYQQAELEETALKLEDVQKKEKDNEKKKTQNMEL